ncbi:Alpha/Beta hydrolase protein [Aspergillus similis]
MIGLTTGNGPISFDGSSTRFGHVLYVDQPVGTGLSTASERYPAFDIDVSEQVHLMRESWAGVYIPSFASTIVDNLDSFSMIYDAILACGFDDVLDHAARFRPEGSIYIPGNPNGENSKRRRSLSNIFGGISSIHLVTAEEVQTSIYSSCYGSANKLCNYDFYDISHDCHTIDHFSLVAQYFSPSASTSESAASPTSSVPPTHHRTDTVAKRSSSPLAAATPQPPVYSILPELVISHNISLHIYFGEYGMLLNHYGAEPNPKGTCKFPGAGKWASECGVTYHRFRGAGHSVFLISKPREMFAYVRDVVVAPTVLI